MRLPRRCSAGADGHDIAYTRPVLWEVVFMLVILKIPVVYLCAVVWWAVKAEPRPEEGAATSAWLEPSLGPAPPCDWRSRMRKRTRRPRPTRGGPASARRTALLRVGVRP